MYLKIYNFKLEQYPLCSVTEVSLYAYIQSHWHVCWSHSIHSDDMAQFNQYNGIVLASGSGDFIFIS